MNNKFLEEAKFLSGRWAKSNLLKGLDRKTSRQMTAVLLECQSLTNEEASENPNQCSARNSCKCPIKDRGDCPHDKKSV